MPEEDCDKKRIEPKLVEKMMHRGINQRANVDMDHAFKNE